MISGGCIYNSWVIDNLLSTPADLYKLRVRSTVTIFFDALVRANVVEIETTWWTTMSLELVCLLFFGFPLLVFDARERAFVCAAMMM